MKIDVLTLFPEMFAPLKTSIIGRAVDSGKLEINIVDIRDYTLDKHKKCDDTPFGGGAGMVMMPQPIAAALEAGKLGAYFLPPSSFQTMPAVSTTVAAVTIHSRNTTGWAGTTRPLSSTASSSTSHLRIMPRIPSAPTVRGRFLGFRIVFIVFHTRN